MRLRGLCLLFLVSAFPCSLFSNTVYFPQIALGGGYSTTVVIMNTGTTSVSGRLNFYTQGGTSRSDLSALINVAVGGSARFTLPDNGALTVLWAEFLAGSGTVQGVATFDLRDRNGVLRTSAPTQSLPGKPTFTASHVSVPSILLNRPLEVPANTVVGSLGSTARDDR